MLGARPPGVRVLTGEEGREVLGADPWVALVRLRPLVGQRGAQPVTDRRELAIRELEQPSSKREPAVEIMHVLVGNGSLVTDVVLELGPSVLQDRAYLHLHASVQHGLVRRRPAPGRVQR